MNMKNPHVLIWAASGILNLMAWALPGNSWRPFTDWLITTVALAILVYGIWGFNKALNWWRHGRRS